jgi:hypothetical protein
MWLEWVMLYPGPVTPAEVSLKTFSTYTLKGAVAACTASGAPVRPMKRGSKNAT